MGREGNVGGNAEDDEDVDGEGSSSAAAARDADPLTHAPLMVSETDT